MFRKKIINNEKKNFTKSEIEELKRRIEYNQKKMDKDYEEMEAGVKQPTKNYILSQDIEDSIQKFLDEGYEIYENTADYFNKHEFLNKKCRYILNDDKVRLGGIITGFISRPDKFDSNKSEEFITIKPFFGGGPYRNGWSVSINNIQFFFIKDIEERKVYALDDPEITNKLKNVMNIHNMKNKRDLYKKAKELHKEITVRHVDYFYKNNKEMFIKEKIKD